MFILVGCRHNSDCPAQLACVNRECIDPCLSTQCGVNARCIADSYHHARCHCLPNHAGDPLVQCLRPECSSDRDCPHDLACRNQRCVDPCDCAPGAQCTVINHRAQCSCPTGYAGDPHTACKIGKSLMISFK